MAQTIELLAGGLSFPESPRWRAGANGVDGELWFVDGARLSRWSRGGGLRTRTVPETRVLLGLALRPDGSALTCGSQERIVWEWTAGGDLRRYRDLRGSVSSPLNEVVVTDEGTILVGPMGSDPLRGETPRSTRLLQLASDGAVSFVGPDLWFPNGLALDAATRDLYVAESFAQRITVIGLPTHDQPYSSRPFADLGRWGGHPDGIALDIERGVWYADPRAGQVVRVDAHGDRQRVIELDQRSATSCALGGEDGRTLFITATDRMPTPDFAFEGDGVLLATRVDVPGMPTGGRVGPGPHP